MSEAQETAGALFRAGKLAPAVDQAGLAVKKAPGDLAARVLLSELAAARPATWNGRTSFSMRRRNWIRRRLSSWPRNSVSCCAPEMARPATATEMAGCRSSSASRRRRCAKCWQGWWRRGKAMPRGGGEARGRRGGVAATARPRPRGRAGLRRFSRCRRPVLRLLRSADHDRQKYMWIPTERVESIEFRPPRRHRATWHGGAPACSVTTTAPTASCICRRSTATTSRI